MTLRVSPNVLYGAGIGLAIFASLVRLLSYPFFTSDYTYFVKVWFDTLSRSPGLTAFAHPFADYAPLYLYFIKLLTYIPLSPLVLEKTLSLVFDLVIAWVVYALVKRYGTRPVGTAFLAGVVTFALPTVMANSTFWGQSDSVYTAFVLLSFYTMFFSSPLIAALLFGLALSIKAQAIFFLPLFIGWLYRRGALFPAIVIPPLVFAATIIPAWLQGGDLWYWLTIYSHQAHEYPYLSVSAQSVFAFVQPLGISITLATTLFWVGIGAGLVVSLFVISYTAYVEWLSSRTFVLLALASTLILPYVLPRMHERYFYMADIFATLYAFFAPNRWWLAAIVVFCSLISYIPFLSGQIGFLKGVPMDLRVPAALLLVPIGFIIYDLVRAWRAMPARLSPEAPS